MDRVFIRLKTTDWVSNVDRLGVKYDRLGVKYDRLGVKCDRLGVILKFVVNNPAGEFLYRILKEKVKTSFALIYLNAIDWMLSATGGEIKLLFYGNGSLI